MKRHQDDKKHEENDSLSQGKGESVAPGEQGVKETAGETPSVKEFEELKAKLRELEGLKEKMLRTAADFENSKKRLQKERDEFAKFAHESLIRELLPILDNMERAVSHAGDFEEPKLQGVVTGIQRVMKQLMDLLKNRGLSRFQSVGQIFDPHSHEAVGYVAEVGKEDEITEEVEAGYRLYEKLLRPAKVKVRARPDSLKSDEEKQEEIT